MINPFKFDFVHFESKLTEFYRTFVTKRHELYPEEVFYWYGLDTYEEFGRLCPIADSEGDVNRRVEEALQSHPEVYRGMTRQNLCWYWRYDGATWDYLTTLEVMGLERAWDELHTITSKGQRQFDGTFATARLELGDAKAQEYVQPFIDKFRAVCIGVLQRFDQEGMFSTTADRSNVLVTFKMHDEFEQRDLEILNPPDAILKYRTAKAKAQSFDNQIYKNMKSTRL